MVDPDTHKVRCWFAADVERRARDVLKDHAHIKLRQHPIDSGDPLGDRLLVLRCEGMFRMIDLPKRHERLPHSSSGRLGYKLAGCMESQVREGAQLSHDASSSSAAAKLDESSSPASTVPSGAARDRMRAPIIRVARTTARLLRVSGSPASCASKSAIISSRPSMNALRTPSDWRRMSPANAAAGQAFP